MKGALKKHHSVVLNVRCSFALEFFVQNSRSVVQKELAQESAPKEMASGGTQTTSEKTGSVRFANMNAITCMYLGQWDVSLDPIKQTVSTEAHIIF